MANYISNKHFWQAVATLIGTIIGAGVLAIPFVISRVGLWPGLFYLVLLGLASLILNLMIAEILLRIRYRHQLVGLTKKFLGVTAGYLQAVSMMVGYYGALTAYIIGQGEVLAVIFGQSEGSMVFFSLLFFGVGVLILLIGLRLIKKVELWLVGLIVLVMLVITGLSLSRISVENYYYLDLANLFFPYGVILFAFGGAGAVYSVREILRGQEHLIRPAIIWGSGLPILIYGFFAIVVLGVTGLATTDIATLGLGQVLGSKLVLFGNLFAFLAMATSFLTVGLALRQMYQHDCNVPRWLAWILVTFIPLLLFLYVSKDFIQVISVAGSFTFGISGILIVLAYWRAKKQGDQLPVFNLPKFKFIGGILIVMFVLGIIFTVIDLLT